MSWFSQAGRADGSLEAQTVCMLDDPVCAGSASALCPPGPWVEEIEDEDGELNYLATHAAAKESVVITETDVLLSGAGGRSCRVGDSVSRGAAAHARAERDFARGMAWLDSHQHPADCQAEGVEIVHVGDVPGERDGLGTKAHHLANRVTAPLLAGKLVVLDGFGWGGYTSSPKCAGRRHVSSLECLLQPFSRCLLNGTARADVAPPQPKHRGGDGTWPRMPPADLVARGEGWWHGLMLSYLLRPNAELAAEIDGVASRLALPGDYVSVAMRRGDKPGSHAYSFERYAAAAEYMADRLRRDAGVMAGRGKVRGEGEVAFVATDSAELARRAASYSGELHAALLPASPSASPAEAPAARPAEPFSLRMAVRSAQLSHDMSKRSGGSVGVGPGAAAAAEGVDLGMRSAVSAGIDADKRARQLEGKGEAKGEGKGEGADAGLDEFSLRMAREVLTDLLLLSRARLISGMMSSVLFRAAAAMAISQGRLISPPVAVDADWWRLPGQVNTEPFVPLPVAVPGEQVPYIIPPTPTHT